MWKKRETTTLLSQVNRIKFCDSSQPVRTRSLCARPMCLLFSLPTSNFMNLLTDCNVIQLPSVLCDFLSYLTHLLRDKYTTQINISQTAWCVYTLYTVYVVSYQVPPRRPCCYCNYYYINKYAIAVQYFDSTVIKLITVLSENDKS